MQASIRNRIYRSFLILVSLFVVNGIITILTLNKSKTLFDHISTVIDPSQQGLSDFKSLLIESKMYTTNWVFLRSNAGDKQALKQLHTIKYPKLKSDLTRLFAKLENPRLNDSLQQVFKGFNQLLLEEDFIMTSLKKSGDYDDPVIKLTAEQTIEDRVIPCTARLMNSLEKVAANERAIKIRAYRNQELYSTRLRTLIIILAITIILIGIFLSSYLTIIIIRPINHIISMINDLGKGKLTTVNLPKNNDEIGYMVRAVNDLSNKLRETAWFASETGKRNFTIDLAHLSDEDVLGKALLTMRSNLKISEQELLNTAENLIQRNKELEQFTYIISHNLRAPVANIMGLYQLLAIGADDKNEEEKLIADLGTSIKKLDNVILDLNHILQVKQQVNEQMETVSFFEMVEDVKEIFHSYTEEFVEFKCDFSAIDTTHSLKSYVFSIFYNLISNSIKYKRAEEKLLLEIKSYKKDNKIVIHFKDNGKGIDLKYNGDKVFGLYKRFDESVEGKGIGLFMVKTQIETLGGSIEVKSKLNNGTTFIVELPRYPLPLKTLPEINKKAAAI